MEASGNALEVLESTASPSMFLVEELHHLRQEGTLGPANKQPECNLQFQRQDRSSVQTTGDWPKDKSLFNNRPSVSLAIVAAAITTSCANKQRRRSRTSG